MHRVRDAFKLRETSCETNVIVLSVVHVRGSCLLMCQVVNTRYAARELMDVWPKRERQPSGALRLPGIQMLSSCVNACEASSAGRGWRTGGRVGSTCLLERERLARLGTTRSGKVPHQDVEEVRPQEQEGGLVHR